MRNENCDTIKHPSVSDLQSSTFRRSTCSLAGGIEIDNEQILRY
ncbi:MAG: hypothetical protein Q7J98_13710 [Kiritimatiellia bacterium]|nr:hypothetical protein [Kiritimatiellia bacterium]